MNDRTAIKDLLYDENEIIKHLDYLITEGIEEYILLHINPNDNIHYTENIKNIIETSSLPITIMIAGMDNSLFVPYKQYIFSFFVI